MGRQRNARALSRHTLRRFLDEQRFDLYAARQLRLVVETLDGRAVGLVDLFEFEPVDLRAGIGILIHGAGDRGRGFASDALDVLCRYARQVLGLHQLWCSVAPDNAASLTLFRRAGFVECGRKREWRRTPDGWADELLLQKIF